MPNQIVKVLKNVHCFFFKRGVGLHDGVKGQRAVMLSLFMKEMKCDDKKTIT